MKILDEICANCRWSVGDRHNCQCRRHGPTSNENRSNVYFPRTHLDNTCGDFEREDFSKDGMLVIEPDYSREINQITHKRDQIGWVVTCRQKWDTTPISPSFKSQQECREWAQFIFNVTPQVREL